MQFMAPVTVLCETCQGHRFQPEVLAVRYHGRNISEVLDLSLRAIAVINGEHRGAYSLQQWLTEPRGVIRGPARRGEFRSIAHDFHAARAHNPWHAARAAELSADAPVGQNE